MRCFHWQILYVYLATQIKGKYIYIIKKMYLFLHYFLQWRPGQNKNKAEWGLNQIKNMSKISQRRVSKSSHSTVTLPSTYN